MNKRIFCIFVIISALSLSACSKEEIVDTVNNAEKAIVSGANDVVADVSNMITETGTEVTHIPDREENSGDSIPAETTQYIKKIKPDLMQIRNACELATVKCCFNNVARSDKLKGSGLSHTGEKDRKFWIEYSGHIDIGIDMSEIAMETDENIITITIPRAKVLRIETDAYSDDYLTFDKDTGINKNPLRAADASEAIKQANEQLIEEYNSNSTIIANAQDRARKLIENYIMQIGVATNVEYDIKWNYE